MNSADSKQSTESPQAALISGHKNESRRIPIEAMHQPELRATALKSCDEGIALMGTKSGLTQQAGWLVDHQILRMLEHERTAYELRSLCRQRIKA